MLRRLLPLVLLVGAGCSTPVGNYFANRGRDFAECWRAEVGVGYGLGAGVRAAGLAHVGVGGFIGGAAGWAYGAPARWGEDSLEFEWWFPIAPMLGGGCLHVRSTRPAGSCCWGVLPCLLSSTESTSESRWIWTATGPPARLARLHAFDIEVSVTLFAGTIRLGFSPGEFVDFLLGWFGLDIAGDDRPLPIPDSP